MNATAIAQIRAYCAQLDTQATICRERNRGTACIRCTEAARIASDIRALLPSPDSTNPATTRTSGATS